MAKTNVAKTKKQEETLRAILKELRLLRKEIEFSLPQENVEDFVHSDRIKNSYQKAVKKYPLASSCSSN